MHDCRILLQLRIHRNCPAAEIATIGPFRARFKLENLSYDEFDHFDARFGI